jgi:antitoxin YefM
MDAISYSSARENLAKTMDRVCKDHDVVIITRKKSESVVMMSLEDYNSIEETGYLLKSSANAKRLRDSIQQYEQGKCQKQKTIEE